MGIPEQETGDAVKLVGIVRHEFPAVAHFRRGLVARAVCKRVDGNDFAPLAVSECIVEGVEFPIDCPVAVPLLDPLLAPVAVFIAGGIGYDFDSNGLPSDSQTSPNTSF
jgi:hypothetical protein